MGNEKNQHENTDPFVDCEGSLVATINGSQESAPGGLNIHSGKTAGPLVEETEQQYKMKYSLDRREPSYFLHFLYPLFSLQAKKFP